MHQIRSRLVLWPQSPLGELTALPQATYLNLANWSLIFASVSDLESAVLKHNHTMALLHR